MPIYDLTLYDLNDLFKIRDACVQLAKYDLHNRDLLQECNKEIYEREKPLLPDDPEEERDIDIAGD